MRERSPTAQEEPDRRGESQVRAYGVPERLRLLVLQGELTENDAQVEAAVRLEACALRVLAADRLRLSWGGAEMLRSWFGLRDRRRPDPSLAPRGVYLAGGVGRGKTMLMDLLVDSLLMDCKLRTHFHDFMSDIHERITEHRKTNQGDPLPSVARSIRSQASLLCLDDLYVDDIATAMIVGRLFGLLLQEGVEVIITSNFKPSELYKDGLQRERFLPFVHLIEAQLDFVPLDHDEDFRLRNLGERDLYLVPADHDADERLDDLLISLAGGVEPHEDRLCHHGREVYLPRVAGGVVRADFSDLCQKPLSGLDYVRLVHRFHTFVIGRVPQLNDERLDWTRRFMTMVDAIYDRRSKLMLSAAAGPDDIYQGSRLKFEFERTRSRLIEMQSQTYRSMPLRQSRVDSLPELVVREEGLEPSCPKDNGF